MSYPLVSVVIPAYNAQDTIVPAVEAVLAQKYEGSFELIVVDDGSRDGTRQKIGAYPQVRYAYQDNAGPACARNHGARLSRGEIVLFTDSDCRPEPGWIRGMVAGFSSAEIGVVAGSYAIANPESLLARVIHAEILYRHHRLMPEFPKAFGSYNFAIRKKVFEAVGGFDVGYRCASGEDNDLSYKVLAFGSRIRFCKEIKVAHVHQSDLPAYLQEQFRHGFWRVKMYADHPGMAAGDDYTFWKDIVEVPAVCLHAGLFLAPSFIAAAAGFLLFEIVWGGIMTRRAGDGLAAGGVMWLRSFARSAGFAGGFFYFLKYLLKSNKKI